MGKKKGKKKGNGEEEVAVEEEKGPITVVLKVDMDCEGCSKKVKGSLKGFDGVVEVKGDVSGNQLTVVGKVDPEKIRDRVESKTKKKVVLVSPLPKKGKDSGGGGGDHKKEKEEKKKPEDQEKKAKEQAPATTVVLKLQLHCQGCVEKIRRIISKTKGVELIEMDRQKDLVTMKGTIDFKAFLTHLQDKLKRNVQIIPAKKEAGEGKQGGKEDNKKGEEANKKRSDQEGKKMEAWENSVATDRMEYWGYGYNIDAGVHAPQLFSDENPNACSIM